MRMPCFGMGALSLLIAGSAVAQEDDQTRDDKVMLVTSSNTISNALLVYDAKGNPLASIPTRGIGGVTGNAGGIAQNRRHLAVVNFKSQNVSIFLKDTENASFRLEAMIPAADSPVSVALSEDHLYILTATRIESHRMGPAGFTASADGSAALLVGDGSAAQVGILPGELIITEKSNAIETINLNDRGAVTGTVTPVKNIPADVAKPLGLITRGSDAYISIAGINEVSLVRNNMVKAIASSGDQNAPCWLALDGSFLYSSNSPSKSVSRFGVYGQKITPDDLIAAKFAGEPTDIAAGDGLAGVIDSDGTASHLSVFKVEHDGELRLRGMATISSQTANGIVIVTPE